MSLSAPPMWTVRLTVAGAMADACADALDEIAVSVARFAADGDADEGEGGAEKLWRLEALCETAPDVARVALILARAARAMRAGTPDFTVERLPETDWLALNRAQFPPVCAGRFYVVGSHFDGIAPAGATVLRLDAGPAFGSGTHETTRGCLLAIDEILTEKQGVARALDLGCGSGILALAVAKAGGCAVLASDSDPVAAATARANAAANGLAGLVETVAETGVGERVRAGAPYDLVCANILAGPLIALAPDVAAVLAPGGRLVLSGLLARQEREVTAAYGAEGLTRARSIMLGDWSTLVLKGPPAPAG